VLSDPVWRTDPQVSPSTSNRIVRHRPRVWEGDQLTKGSIPRRCRTERNRGLGVVAVNDLQRRPGYTKYGVGSSWLLWFWFDTL